MNPAENMQGEKGREIRPCLIGGFTDKNVVSPPRFNAVSVGENSLCSLDMVRLSLTFSDGEKLNELAEFFPCDDRAFSFYVARVKPGGVRYLYTLPYGESSVTLGIGLMSKSSKVNMHKGWIEFNPNKVAGSELFKKMWKKLSRYVSGSELKRFDLALDVPVDRQLVRVEKDRRTWTGTQSDSLTEYLGARSSIGFTKVYDKAKESKLGDDVKLTRVELTCSGDWSVCEIGEHWPVVYRVSSSDDLKPKDKVIALLLSEKVERGETIEPYLKMLDYRTRKAFRDKFEDRTAIPFPELGAAQILMQAHNWATSLIGGAPVEVVES